MIPQHVDLTTPIFSVEHVIAICATIIGGLLSGVLVIWRKLRGVRIDNAKAHAEIDVIQSFASQRDFAIDEAKHVRVSLRASQMEAENYKAKAQMLEREVFELKTRVNLLSQLVTRLTAALDVTKNQLTELIKQASSPKPNP